MTAHLRSQLATGCLAISLGLSLLSVASTVTKGPLDFGPIYAAGIAVRHGQNPYSIATMCDIERGRVPAAAECFPYLDPPPFTAVVLPFSFLSFKEASFLWVPMLLAFGLAVVLLAGRLSGLALSWSLRTGLLVAAGALVFSPIKHGAALGQIDSISAALALGAISLSTSPMLAGALAVLALLVKPQPVFLPAGALVLKRPRILMAARSGPLRLV
jgi:hypothetical protein